MTQERSEDLFQRAEREAAERGYVLPEVSVQGSFDGLPKDSFGDAFGAAVEVSTTAYLRDYLSEQSAGNRGPAIDASAAIKADPSYSERVSRLPQEYQEKLAEATTDEQLRTMLLNAEKTVHYENVLANTGAVNSIGAQIAAGLLDPTEFVVGLTTGGLGALALKGKTVGKAGMAGLSALEAGVSNAALTGALSQQNPTISVDDVLTSFVVGAAIGAPIGYVAGRDTARIGEAAGNFARTVGVGKQSAAEFNVNTYMRKNRVAESGGRDNVGPTTSNAFGRYQFIPSTWVSYYKKTFGKTKESRAAIIAKRSDGDVQDKVMETFTREQVSKLQQNGIAVNDTSVYLMHFLGEGDALKVLQAQGNAYVKNLVRPASMKANSTVFKPGMTAQQLIDWAARKMKAPTMAPTGAVPGSTASATPEALESPATLFRSEEQRFEAEAAEALDDFAGEIPDVMPRAPQSVGAAARGVDEGEYFGTQFTLPGAYARMLSSSVPASVRQTFGSLINSVARKDNNTRTTPAEVTSSRMQTQYLSTAYQDYNPAFRSWAKERGIGLVRQEFGSGPQQEFMREVTRAMRGADDVSPQAREAGDALAKGYSTMLRDMKRAGIEGFEDIPENAKYVPRIINERKLMTLYRTIGMDGIQRVLRKSLVGGGMEEELATRVARAYAEGSVDRATTSSGRAARLRGLADDDIERLRYYLPSDDPELINDVISSLKNFRNSRNPSGGRISRARYRLEMDELAEETINGVSYRVTDLFEDDAWQLYERYARTASGWVGLAERANVRSEAEWDILMGNLKEQHKGDPRWKEYEEKLEDVKSLILGNPIFTENGTLRRTAQSAMKLNFITTMGQAGMASFAELGNVVAYAGFKNMLMHLPIFRGVWQQAKSGQLDKEFTDELRAMGFGMKMALGRGRAGADEWGNPIENQIADTVDRILDPFQRTVGFVGLLGPMNDFLQNLAAKSFVQKFATVARGKKNWTEGEILRLRDAGFEDGVLDRALEEIRNHATFDGDRIVGLGLDKWNRDIAMDFRDALDQMTYRAVQDNDIGSSAWWMQSTMGRMLTQFRSFIGNALIKQTLHAARYRKDPQVWAAFAFTMFFGGISYTGRSYLNSIGREDQDEFLEKRIGSAKAVALGAFNSSGYASILPGSIDTMLNLAGQDPLFQMGRTSGLASSFVTGNPTYALANNLSGTVRMASSLPREDYEFSQEDLRRLQAIAPLGNVTGIRNGFALLNQELPKRSQEDEYWQ